MLSFSFCWPSDGVPPLWALPAGIGDILVGASAFRVARNLNSPGGRRRAIVFDLLGMADLIIAVGLGIATNPGPLHLFHATPTSELLTGFPLAVVPTFLVPLAFTIHVISTWQLMGLRWTPMPEGMTQARSAGLQPRAFLGKPLRPCLRHAR